MDFPFHVTHILNGQKTIFCAVLPRKIHFGIKVEIPWLFTNQEIKTTNKQIEKQIENTDS